MSDFTQDFLTSRRNFPDGTTRIGEEGRLWYDSITNTIRISDGITPGGILVIGGGTGSGYSGYSGISGYSGLDGTSGYSGLGLSPWQKKISDYYAINNDRIIADTGGGSFKIYLPSSPVLGDYVQITDGNDFYTNHLLVNPNGSTIEGYTEDICLDLRGVTFEFIYSGATWQVTGTTGAKGDTGLSGYSGAPGDRYLTSSTSTLTVGLGPQSLNVEAGLAYSDSQIVRIVHDENNFMEGPVTFYDHTTGAIIVNSTSVTGSGTYSSWTVNLTGAVGISGSSGYSGYSGTSGYSGASGYGVNLAGVVNTFSDLPTGVPIGNLYITTDTGDGWVSNGDDTWTNTGPLQGPSGISGYSGESGISGYSGESGISGYSGASGYGVQLSGTVPTASSLPNGVPAGDLYITADTGDGWVSNGDNTWTNTGPLQGPSGISGFSGQAGVDGISGFSGFSGQTGVDGISGYSGQAGVDGISGYSGFSGAAGAVGESNLIWSVSGTYRTLTSYRNTDSTISTIRVAEFSNNLLRLTLASFTPILSSAVTPSGSLSWDVPATGFTVTVNNPDDIPNEYITAVFNITPLSGSISPFIDFTAGAQSATPGPGVDWNQTFSTAGVAYIRSTSTTISGGSASANVFFKYWNGSTETNFTNGNASFSVSWATPSMSLSLGGLSGSTFLQTYNSTSYSLSVTGVSNPANYSNSLSAVGGIISNLTGSGTFTFTDPIHKNNTGTTRTVSNTTTFTRPATVTGTSYTSTLSSTTGSPSAAFTYPSLWVFTPSTFDIPTRSSYVSGSGFAPGVTVLGNQVKVINGYINNTSTEPKGFWMAVRTSASQPTQFKTGASPSLLSDVTAVTGNTVGLAPDVLPPGYVAESYTLYGITLQAGSTYVSIS